MKPITKILLAFLFMFWTYYSCAELEKQSPLSMRDTVSDTEDLDNYTDDIDLPEVDLPEVDLPEDDPYEVAIKLYNEAKYEEALPWFEKAVEKDNLNAYYYLGLMHYSGLGTTKDISKAYDWYKDAADKEHPPSQYAVGRMYYYGEEGIAQDTTQAYDWFQKSADQGNANAQYYIGKKYYYGSRTQAIDYPQSMEWFKKSADQGHRESQYHLGRLYYLTHSGMTKDFPLAYDWFQKSAAQGQGEAIRYTGLFHYSGIGDLTSDKSKAFEYWSDTTPYYFPISEKTSTITPIEKILAVYIARETANCFLQINDCGGELNVDEGIRHLKIAATTYWDEASIIQLGEIYETGKPQPSAEVIPSVKNVNAALNLYNNCYNQINSSICKRSFDDLLAAP